MHKIEHICGGTADLITVLQAKQRWQQCSKSMVIKLVLQKAHSMKCWSSPCVLNPCLNC